MKGLLFVLLAGVAVGMLLAPDKGSESWKKLADSLDDVKKKTMDEIDGLVSKGKDLASKGKKAARNASNARLACARVKRASSAILPTSCLLFTRHLSMPASNIKRPAPVSTGFRKSGHFYLLLTASELPCTEPPQKTRVRI